MLRLIFVILHCVQAEILVNIRGPEVIVYGTRDAVTLDCDFYTESFKDFGLRWIYSNHSNPKPQVVFRWKPPAKPQAYGVFKNKLDLSYTVSNNTFTKHRALRILKPVPEMSGKYTCLVSNSASERNKTHSLTIFDPEKTFDLFLHRREDGYLNVMCIVQGIYPKPQIKLLADNTTLDAESNISLNGTYTALVTTFLKISAIHATVEIRCELKVPEANYFSYIKDIFFKDPLPTITAEVPDPSSSTENGTRKTTPALNLLYLLMFLVLIPYYIV